MNKKGSTITTLRQKALRKVVLKCPSSRKNAMLKAGYSPSYSLSGSILKTNGWKAINKPILERYQAELKDILNALALKDKNSEEYRTLIEAMNATQRQIQLLTGGATVNVGLPKPILQLEESKDIITQKD